MSTTTTKTRHIIQRNAKNDGWGKQRSKINVNSKEGLNYQKNNSPDHLLVTDCVLKFNIGRVNVIACDENNK